MKISPRGGGKLQRSVCRARGRLRVPHSRLFYTLPHPIFVSHHSLHWRVSYTFFIFTSACVSLSFAMEWVGWEDLWCSDHWWFWDRRFPFSSSYFFKFPFFIYLFIFIINLNYYKWEMCTNYWTHSFVSFSLWEIGITFFLFFRYIKTSFFIQIQQNLIVIGIT